MQFLIFFWLSVFILYPTIGRATECEAVPVNKELWVTEEIVRQKLQADAVLLGTVLQTYNIGQGELSQCGAYIKPSEVFKGHPGEKIEVRQINNRYEGARENKCAEGWLKENERYLFYVNNTARGQTLPQWYFPFCSLEAYIPYEAAGKEIDIIREISQENVQD